MGLYYDLNYDQFIFRQKQFINYEKVSVKNVTTTLAARFIRNLILHNHF